MFEKIKRTHFLVTDVLIQLSILNILNLYKYQVSVEKQKGISPNAFRKI